MKRREFLDKFTVGIVSSAGAIAIAASISEILPPSTEHYNLIKLGDINSFPLNDFTFIPGKKIYIYRSRENIRAISGVCTHLGCTINKDDKGFKCPCHGSQFNEYGLPSSGPASRPLDRYQASLDKKGHLVVDLSKKVTEDYKIETGEV